MENSILSAHQASCIKNSLLAIGSTTLLFGPQMAIISGIATASLHLLNKNSKDYSWFPINKFHDFMDLTAEILPRMLVTSLIWGFSFYLSGTKVFQAPLKWLLSSSSISEKIMRIFDICLMGPFIEEVFFRGVLLDGMRNIHQICSGFLGNADTKLAKIFRTAVQASIFGAAHIHKIHTKAQNMIVVALTTAVGFVQGWLKEEYGHRLWHPTALHFSINCSVTARTLLFGA